jgi:hypothetical protein
MEGWPDLAAMAPSWPPPAPLFPLHKCDRNVVTAPCKKGTNGYVHRRMFNKWYIKVKKNRQIMKCSELHKLLYSCQAFICTTKELLQSCQAANMTDYTESPSHYRGKRKFRKEKGALRFPAEQPTFQQSYWTNQDNKMQTNLRHNI